MALSEGVLEDRICKFLMQSYPNFVSLEAIATKVQEGGNKVSRELHRKLIPKRLCEKAADMEGHVFRGTEFLRARFEETEACEAAVWEGEERAEEAFYQPPGVSLAPAGAEPSSGKKGSVLPVKAATRRTPSRAPPVVQQPYYVQPQPWGHVPGYPNPPPGVLYPAGAVQPQAWYPPPPAQAAAFHTSAPMQLQHLPAPQPQHRPVHPSQPLPTRHQPQPLPVAQQQHPPTKKSLLKLKASSRAPPRQRTPPPVPSTFQMGCRELSVQPDELELSAKKLNSGHFDMSVFPEGIWNQVLYETQLSRQHTLAVDTLKHHSLPQGLRKGEGESGLFGSVGVRPEGRGHRGVSIKPMESTVSMRPPPPGLTLTHQDAASAGHLHEALQRPVSRFTQESSGRGTDGGSVSSHEFTYME